MKTFVVIGLGVLLGGCASATKKDAERKQWYDLGYTAGVKKVSDSKNIDVAMCVDALKKAQGDYETCKGNNEYLRQRLDDCLHAGEK